MPAPSFYGVLSLYTCGHDGTMHEEMNKRNTQPRAPGQHPQAVIYARVSSKEQEKEGYSIPAQFKLLRDHARVHDLQVVQEFTDVETAKKAGRKAFGEWSRS